MKRKRKMIAILAALLTIALLSVSVFADEGSTAALGDDRNEGSISSDENTGNSGSSSDTGGNSSGTEDSPGGTDVPDGTGGDVTSYTYDHLYHIDITVDGSFEYTIENAEEEDGVSNYPITTVTKVWEDGEENHENDTVTLYLLDANGDYITKTVTTTDDDGNETTTTQNVSVVLSAENNWTVTIDYGATTIEEIAATLLDTNAEDDQSAGDSDDDDSSVTVDTYVYAVEEVLIKGQSVSESGYVVTDYDYGYDEEVTYTGSIEVTSINWVMYESDLDSDETTAVSTYGEYLYYYTDANGNTYPCTKSTDSSGNTTYTYTANGTSYTVTATRTYVYTYTDSDGTTKTQTVTPVEDETYTLSESDSSSGTYTYSDDDTSYTVTSSTSTNGTTTYSLKIGSDSNSYTLEAGSTFAAEDGNSYAQYTCTVEDTTNNLFTTYTFTVVTEVVGSVDQQSTSLSYYLNVSVTDSDWNTVYTYIDDSGKTQYVSSNVTWYGMTRYAYIPGTYYDEAEDENRDTNEQEFFVGYSSIEDYTLEQSTTNTNSYTYTVTGGNTYTVTSSTSNGTTTYTLTVTDSDNTSTTYTLDADDDGTYSYDSGATEDVQYKYTLTIETDSDTNTSTYTLHEEIIYTDFRSLTDFTKDSTFWVNLTYNILDEDGKVLSTVTTTVEYDAAVGNYCGEIDYTSYIGYDAVINAEAITYPAYVYNAPIAELEVTKTVAAAYYGTDDSEEVTTEYLEYDTDDTFDFEIVRLANPKTTTYTLSESDTTGTYASDSYSVSENDDDRYTLTIAAEDEDSGTATYTLTGSSEEGIYTYTDDDGTVYTLTVTTVEGDDSSSSTATYTLEVTTYPTTTTDSDGNETAITYVAYVTDADGNMVANSSIGTVAATVTTTDEDGNETTTTTYYGSVSQGAIVTLGAGETLHIMGLIDGAVYEITELGLTPETTDEEETEEESEEDETAATAAEDKDEEEEADSETDYSMGDYTLAQRKVDDEDYSDDSVEAMTIAGSITVTTSTSTITDEDGNSTSTTTTTTTNNELEFVNTTETKTVTGSSENDIDDELVEVGDVLTYTVLWVN